jgi:mono/diheme cytochrome c family protein
MRDPKLSPSARLLLPALFFLLTAGCRADEATGPGLDYDGAELYALNCSNCHGVYGEGDGAVTPALSVVLLDLRYLAERNGGRFPSEFVQSIVDGREIRAAHGPSGMPIWGAEFSKGEGLGDDAQDRVTAKIAAVTSFLESIQIIE